MPDVSKIVAFEEGELGYDETLLLFADLIKSGMAWSLQGFYGRTAQNFIDNEFISADGQILVPLYDE